MRFRIDKSELILREEVVETPSGSPGLTSLLFLFLFLSLNEEVRVDVLLDRQNGIEKLLHDLAAISKLVLRHLAGMHRCLVDHPAVRAREVYVVPEEVNMPEHM